MAKRVVGTHRIEITSLKDGSLRVRLMIGEVADGRTHDFEAEPEGVEISVLVDIPDNPPLLDVHVAALERAQEMIAEQIAALQRASE